jgi:hypothetical protein
MNTLVGANVLLGLSAGVQYVGLLFFTFTCNYSFF